MKKKFFHWVDPQPAVISNLYKRNSYIILSAFLIRFTQAEYKKKLSTRFWIWRWKIKKNFGKSSFGISFIFGSSIEFHYWSEASPSWIQMNDDDMTQPCYKKNFLETKFKKNGANFLFFHSLIDLELYDNILIFMYWLK